MNTDHNYSKCVVITDNKPSGDTFPINANESMGATSDPTRRIRRFVWEEYKHGNWCSTDLATHFPDMMDLRIRREETDPPSAVTYSVTFRDNLIGSKTSLENAQLSAENYCLAHSSYYFRPTPREDKEELNKGIEGRVIALDASNREEHGKSYVTIEIPYYAIGNVAMLQPCTLTMIKVSNNGK